MSPLLQIKDLHVHFPVRGGLLSRPSGQVVKAVDGVSLDVRQGEILGLVGESGCGKSTLSRTVLQLQRPNSGGIILDGEDLTLLPPRELRKRRLDFQMIFQDPYSSLNPRYTVYSTLAEAASRRKKLSRRETDCAVAELMEKVGLDPRYIKKYPHEFSGGQRQRIAIARALAPNPRLIIADEPVSALDVSIQSQILNLLSRLVKDFGLTMIFISHDLSVVHYISDNIAVMKQGKIVEYGTAGDVFNQPRHVYTQSLLAAVPKLAEA